MTSALIVVDVQNDFVPGGALAVANGHEVVPVVNRLMSRFDLVVATQDWHPPDHGSFASNHRGHGPGDIIELNGLQQILWPDHCVQGTQGADFVDNLDRESIDRVFRKGTDPGIDSYSGFFDNGRRKATGLDKYLRDRGIEKVTVVGLATDYCVKFTALDGIDVGFSVSLVREGVRGVELNPGDCQRALAEMGSAGVRVLDLAQFEASPEL